MSDDHYDVDDWMALEYKKEELTELIEDGELDESVLNEIQKASDFIKETLGIKTNPILTRSHTTDIVYVTNVYTGSGIHIVTYSKRPATEEDIEEFGKK